MIRCALAQFLQEPALQGVDILGLMEITMHNLLASGNIDHEDFLARVDTLAAIGNYVLISNYREFYRLTSYFPRYTKQMVGVRKGLIDLHEAFIEQCYEELYS